MGLAGFFFFGGVAMAGFLAESGLAWHALSVGATLAVGASILGVGLDFHENDAELGMGFAAAVGYAATLFITFLFAQLVLEAAAGWLLACAPLAFAGLVVAAYPPARTSTQSHADIAAVPHREGSMTATAA